MTAIAEDYLWVLLVVGIYIVMVVGREYGHRVILSILQALYTSFRLAARALTGVEQRMSERNREVLLEQGKDQVEREIEQEFERIHRIVEKDLSSFPVAQRKINTLIAELEEDYAQSALVPPPPPEWVKEVNAISKILVGSKNMGGFYSDILENIRTTAENSQQRIQEEHRATVEERHQRLQDMMPSWREMHKRITEMGVLLQDIMPRAKSLDQQMERYEEIRSGSSKAERNLNASASTHFVISLLVTVIAVIGGVVNFNLLAIPMSDMMGGGTGISLGFVTFPVAYVAALVILLIEITMGIFVMESLRITKLFPVIGRMDDRMRRFMLFFSATLLITLACVEASLGFWREQIGLDNLAVAAELGEAEVQATDATWIPVAGQMLLGFILPFALTFVAVPLESLVHSGRIVIANLLLVLVRSLAFLLRWVGNLIRHMGRFLVAIYDLLIFAAWLDRRQWLKTLPPGKQEQAISSAKPPLIEVNQKESMK